MMSAGVPPAPTPRFLRGALVNGHDFAMFGAIQGEPDFAKLNP
jgi:hypothetical protein